MIDCLSDLLGTHTEDMVQPIAAATTLAALITVVVSPSESDLPADSTYTAAIESKLKQANWFVTKQLRRILAMTTTGNIPTESLATRLVQPLTNPLQSIG